MEQQPPRRDGSEDEDTTGYEVSSPLDPLPFPPSIVTREYYKITVDTQGLFHIEPTYLEVAPFRSVGEALASAAEAELDPRIRSRRSPEEPPPPWGDPVVPCARIYTRLLPLLPGRLSQWCSWEYHVTLRGGLFSVHPIDVGGPFQSLGEAAAAIKRHSTWVSATRLLAEGCYFTLKDGCFHPHPFLIGGPFKSLDSASCAVERFCACEKRTKQFFDNFDPVVETAHVKELIEELKSAIRNPKPPEQLVGSWTDEQSEEFDPDVLEAIDRMDRLIERRMAIENGIELMENEVLQAFEFYKKSTDYKGPNYKFVKLDQQCLIYDTFLKSYHHYNFTMKKKSSFYLSKEAKRSLKRPSKNRWVYQVFFAEVKSTEEGKQFVCFPLLPGENGHCFGCQNVGIDLRHPTSGGYEKGHENSGFPFDSDSGSDD